MSKAMYYNYTYIYASLFEKIIHYILDGTIGSFLITVTPDLPQMM